MALSSLFAMITCIASSTVLFSDTTECTDPWLSYYLDQGGNAKPRTTSCFFCQYTMTCHYRTGDSERFSLSTPIRDLHSLREAINKSKDSDMHETRSEEEGPLEFYWSHPEGGGTYVLWSRQGHRVWYSGLPQRDELVNTMQALRDGAGQYPSEK